MTDEQLKVIEREMLFVKEPVVGENIHYRLDSQGDHLLAFNHLNKRREKFAQLIVNPSPFAEGHLPVELQYVEGHQIHRDNLLWKDKKYVIPMRLLHKFLAVSSEIPTDMLITFNIEQEVKKLFEAVFTCEIGDDVERGRRDRDPPHLQTIFSETPKINYNLYTYSPQKQSIEHMAMSQIKGRLVFSRFFDIRGNLRNVNEIRLEKLVSPVKKSALLHASIRQNFAWWHFFDVNGVSIVIS